MSGFPVVIVSNGRGIPAIAVTAGAPPVKVATNGRGVPIVIVEKNGIPLVFEGLPEP